MTGLVAMTAGLMVVVAGFTGGAGAAQTGPVLIEGNPNCAAIDGAETWTEYKYNGDIVSGLTVGVPTVRDAGGLAVTITKVDNYTFDWSTTVGIRAVIVKAADDANVYYYDPAATSGAGLVSVAKTVGQGGGFHAVSHVSFCAGASSPTTSTTTQPEATTTTTQPEATTTTTQPEVTTTTDVTIVVEGTTTSVAVAATTVAQGPTTTVASLVTQAETGGSLPVTGQDVGLMLFGLAVMGSGAGLVFGTRRAR